MKKKVAAGLLCALLLCVLAPLTASAESVDGLTVDVQLDADGAAHITETWEIDATQGTEWYLNKENMGDMEVTGFSVTDETGAQYVNEGEWDVDRSRDQKAGKCGVVTKPDGYELCWGLGKYGQRTYTVGYTMTNFVKAYTDYDGFNVRFLNDQMSSAPAKVDVTIRAPQELAEGQAAVWAFGFAGEIYVEDGVVHAWSDGALSPSNHVTVMVRFEKGIFTPTSTRDEPFSTLEDQALAGSDYTPENDAPAVDNTHTSGRVPHIGLFSFAGFTMIPFLFVIVFVFIIISAVRASGKSGGRISGLGSVSGLDDVSAPDYCRDIPCGGSLPAAYALLEAAGQPGSDGAVMGAFLLRWTYRRLVRIEETEKKGFLGIGAGVQPSIVFLGDASGLSGAELELYEMMREASGSDGILQEKEFYKWSQRHYTKVEGWLSAIKGEGRGILRGMGAVETVPVKRFFGLIDSTEERFTETGRALARDVLGFKKYLKDFTIINERQAVEVELWDDYLVFATLFGIADQVAKEFKELYPKHFEQPDMGYGTNRDIFWTMVMINNMSRAAARGAEAGRSAAESRSSGGGGFSSMGGGGGFSGGGSGGGSR
ncbi:DUF2207 domain-containing protein [Intestinibacillus massiliensis]|nr:DUF2207 domain-containing protein [Intestinibacillus massiliensis]